MREREGEYILSKINYLTSKGLSSIRVVCNAKNHHILSTYDSSNVLLTLKERVKKMLLFPPFSPLV